LLRKLNVKLNAENNQLLFNWVVSFGDVARVVKPAALKKKISEFVDYLKEVYG